MPAAFSAHPSSSRVRDLALAVVVLFLAIQNGLPALQALAQDGTAASQRAVPATSTFTFQGRLDVDGVPQDGFFDFEFALFDNGVVGVGAPLGTGLKSVSDLLVSAGEFTIALDFDTGVFAGEQRWVEVRVRPGDSVDPGAFVTLGRQELTATPYATFALNIPEHDHLGETWIDSFGLGPIEISEHGAIKLFNNDIALSVETIQGASAILGVANVDGAAGIHGVGAGEPGCLASQSCYGVLGDSLLSNGGVGVQGNGGRIGVRGTSPLYEGVRGVGGSQRGFAGVQGMASTGTVGAPCTNLLYATYCYGVIGDALASPFPGGVGVYGAGSFIGVLGRSASSSGWSGYFDGNVEVTGRLDGPNSRVSTSSLMPASGSTYSLGQPGLPWVAVYANNGAIQPSDARLKQDVVSLQAGLDAVLALRPVSYRWVANPGEGAHLGLIAQEVEEVIPGVVHHGESESDPLTMSYTELVPVLIRAIQEQQTRIDALAAELATLR